MRDEITRLAERAANMLDGFEQALRRYAPIEDIEEWPYHPDITDTAAELRALARTAHAEDKLRDEIARLADIADRLDRAHALLELSQEQSSLEAMASKVDYASSALLGAQAALTELRALARTDHTEDKLGMVPEGWGIEQHNGGYMVNPPHGPGCWVSGRDDFNVPLADQALAKLCAAMLAAAPQPEGLHHDLEKLKAANAMLVRWKGEIDSWRIAAGLEFPDDYDNSPRYAVKSLIDHHANRAPDHSAGNCIAAMSRMKDAAMVAHKLCYEAMLKHPDVETLGDDGELHKAIHAIVGVDTPNYVASPDRSADVRVSLHRKARELLAAEYARDGQAFVADRIRTDAMLTHVEDRSLRAIVAALAQPADADADTEGAR